MKRRLKFSLSALFLILTICAITMSFLVRHRPPKMHLPKIESSLRRDLDVPDNGLLHILLVDANGVSRLGAFQEAIVVTEHDNKYRLASYVRNPRNFSNPKWHMQQILISFDDDFQGGWGVFEKGFDHYPTTKDFEKFKKQIEQF